MHNVKKKIKMERQDNSILLQNKIGIIIFEKHRFTYIYSGSYRAGFFVVVVKQCGLLPFMELFCAIVERANAARVCAAHMSCSLARTPPSSCVRNKSCLFISSQLIYKITTWNGYNEVVFAATTLANSLYILLFTYTPQHTVLKQPWFMKFVARREDPKK